MENELYDWRFDERLIKADPKVLQALLDAGLTPFVPSVPLLPIDITYIEVTDEEIEKGWQTVQKQLNK